MAGLDADVKFLKGVGEKRAKVLKKELEISTFGDLLQYFPFRHIDRSRFYSVSEIASGGEMPMVQVRGHFVGFFVEGEGLKRRMTGTFSDGQRMMQVVWFGGIDKIRGLYQVGTDYVLFGKPSLFREIPSMVHPEIEQYDPARPPRGLRGVYSMTEGLRKSGFTQKSFQGMVARILESPAFERLEETLPGFIVDPLHLMSRRDALRNIHFPESVNALRKASERLKFEELFYLELHILLFARNRRIKSVGHNFQKVGALFNKFYNDIIPFPLTGAQKRVIREIRHDMNSGRQMNRLLQGDVGSGKTMVAFMSMLIALDNGFQAALMAPTEILASQHYDSLKPWCDALGISIALLTGSTRVAKRREIHAGLENGSLGILVGTHALIEDSVNFKSLGMAIIDEQHRFGVSQRSRMWSKSVVPPHVLVMTATPIPRTLAMTVYGDLEVSVIDELPPGRKPVSTMLRFDEERMSVYRHLYNEIRAGRQAYIVYPLVHENEKLSLKSVEEGFENIQGKFPELKVVMVHGQMKPEIKEKAMDAFVRGEAHIMVATTVIEVGVNVPNASVMLIENAERFGLSQLHQLRGRVGRGADKSYCILMSHRKIQGDTKKRLLLMTETTDGFLISEADMKMRGPGDMEGTQQSGIAFNLRISNLATDGQMVALARREAEKLLPEDAAVAPVPKEDAVILNRELHSRFAREVDWSRIS